MSAHPSLIQTAQRVIGGLFGFAVGAFAMALIEILHPSAPAFGWQIPIYVAVLGLPAAAGAVLFGRLAE